MENSLELTESFLFLNLSCLSMQGLCQAIAITLQYLYTAAIFWMGIEGIHLYRKVVKVFMKSSVKKHYCIFGWGEYITMITRLVRSLLHFEFF